MTQRLARRAALLLPLLLAACGGEEEAPALEPRGLVILPEWFAVTRATTKPALSPSRTSSRTASTPFSVSRCRRMDALTTRNVAVPLCATGCIRSRAIAYKVSAGSTGESLIISSAPLGSTKPLAISRRCTLSLIGGR